MVDAKHNATLFMFQKRCEKNTAAKLLSKLEVISKLKLQFGFDASVLKNPSCYFIS